VFRLGWLRRDDSPIMEQTGKAIQLLQPNRIITVPNELGAFGDDYHSGVVLENSHRHTNGTK